MKQWLLTIAFVLSLIVPLYAADVDVDSDNDTKIDDTYLDLAHDINGVVVCDGAGDCTVATTLTDTDYEEESHASEHIDDGADAIDGDKIEMSLTLGTITPDTGIAEADSADDLAAIIEGIEDEFDGLSSVYEVQLDNEAGLYAVLSDVSEFLETTDQNAGTDVTGDLEEETHASEHLQGAADEIDGDQLDVDWNPSNYTPDTTPTQVDNVDDLVAHFYGIDQAFAGKMNTESSPQDGALAAWDGTGGADQKDSGILSSISGASTILRIDSTTDGDQLVGKVYDADSTSWVNALVLENAGAGEEGRLILGSANVQVEVSSITIENDTSDLNMASVGRVGLEATDDQFVTHGGSAGEVQGEVAKSLLEHIAVTFDPAYWYDQESTYRVIPLMAVGDDAPEGITITEWSVEYVGGDPTTELDADIMCDTTADYNPAAGATVMDVIDTTTGSSNADTGFDSASCANGAKLYVRFGADPTDANVVVALDIWYYTEAD